MIKMVSKKHLKVLEDTTKTCLWQSYSLNLLNSEVLNFQTIRDCSCEMAQSPIAPALWAEPFIQRGSDQIHALKMEPFDGTSRIVTSNHFLFLTPEFVLRNLSTDRKSFQFSIKNVKKHVPQNLQVTHKPVLS